LQTGMVITPSMRNAARRIRQGIELIAVPTVSIAAYIVIKEQKRAKAAEAAQKGPVKS
jgi:hypothetical protein